MQKLLIVVALLAFGALSLNALWHHGYWGLFAPHLQSFDSAQVLADLVVALTLVMVWMWHDARKTGRNAWPWLVATLALGSFGPLGYLLTRPSSTRSA